MTANFMGRRPSRSVLLQLTCSDRARIRQLEKQTLISNGCVNARQYQNHHFATYARKSGGTVKIGIICAVRAEAAEGVNSELSLTREHAAEAPADA
jgi:hypothetical protein